MRSWIAILPIVLLMGTVSNAQQADQQPVDCQTLLSEAENNFIAGKFYGVPSLLKGCIDAGRFSREEQMRVYMLLTQVYLLTDDPANAEASYLKLLTADPEYVANESVDPIDVVYLSKKFTTTPIFTPHFRIGPNYSTQTILYPFGTVSTPDKTIIDNSGLPGVSMGAGIEWNINDNLGIGGEALYSYKAFATQVTGQFGRDHLLMRERQSWADFPFYVRYGYHLGKMRPFGYAGYAVNVLFANRQHFEYTDEKGGKESGQEQFSGSDPSVMFKRNLLNGSLVFGAGIKYKLGKNFILIDIRYMKGLKKVVIQELNSYSNVSETELGEPATKYTWVDPIFKVNSYSLSFGFVRPLYDPRLVKKARTKGVSRKISGR